MKLLDKIGDNLFRITDRFFQGNRPSGYCSAPVDLECSRQSMVWELNQGVEDILIKDIRGSINYFIPAFIRRPIEQIYRKACLYILVDAVIEDETIDMKEDNKSGLHISPAPKEKKIILTEALNRMSQNILSLQDWFKIRFNQVRYLIRYPRPDRSYYLLGDFTPAINDGNLNGLYYILHESDRTNFRHTFVYHKRN
jgi:hypothetical protein